MPFQLEGTSATHAAPFGRVPVKCALDADADEPVPATRTRARTTAKNVLRSQMPRRITIDLPLLVPGIPPLCLRRQMMEGVSRVEGYLSTALILTHGGAQGAACASLPHTLPPARQD